MSTADRFRGRSDKDDRRTQPRYWEVYHREWNFTIDAAASEANAQLPRYWTVEDDGLAQDWTDERVWCNPPFSDIRPWVEKASERLAEVSVLLLPANRTEQGWWQDLIEPGRREGVIPVRFLRGRMRFLFPGEDRIRPNSRPPFGCCLVIFNQKETCLTP